MRLVLQQHSLNIASYKAVQNFEKLCFGNLQYIFDNIEYIQKLYLDFKWKTRSFESRLVRYQLEWLIPHHTDFVRTSTSSQTGMKTLLVAVNAYLLPLVLVNAYLPPLVVVNGQKRSVRLSQGVYGFTKELNITQKQCNNDTFS